MLPAFTANGLLPQGDYSLTFALLRSSFLVRGRESANGDACVSDWDSVWRGQLVDNLEVLAAPLWNIGIESLWIAGSFVENKAHPGDIDGYFECHPVKILLGELERDLVKQSRFENADAIWTWNEAAKRRTQDGTASKLPMWHQFGVELYPHYPGLKTGLSDRYGRLLEIPQAFRLSRGLIPRGIVRLAPE